MDFTFNVALGREVELYNRVDSNDPANSAIIAVVLALSGIEDDATLKDYDTLGAILAAANNEPGNSGYVRKTLTDSDIAAYTVDDTLDRIVLQMPNLTYTSVAAGDSWAKQIFCYDADTTSGTDTNIIPITAHDLRYSGLPVVPNGTNIVISYANGFVICD